MTRFLLSLTATATLLGVATFGAFAAPVYTSDTSFSTSVPNGSDALFATAVAGADVFGLHTGNVVYVNDFNRSNTQLPITNTATAGASAGVRVDDLVFTGTGASVNTTLNLQLDGGFLFGFRRKLGFASPLLFTGSTVLTTTIADGATTLGTGSLTLAYSITQTQLAALALGTVQAKDLFTLTSDGLFSAITKDYLFDNALKLGPTLFGSPYDTGNGFSLPAEAAYLSISYPNGPLIQAPLNLTTGNFDAPTNTALSVGFTLENTGTVTSNFGNLLYTEHDFNKTLSFAPTPFTLGGTFTANSQDAAIVNNAFTPGVVAVPEAGSLTLVTLAVLPILGVALRRRK